MGSHTSKFESPRFGYVCVLFSDQGSGKEAETWQEMIENQMELLRARIDTLQAQSMYETGLTTNEIDYIIFTVQDSELSTNLNNRPDHENVSTATPEPLCRFYKDL